MDMKVIREDDELTYVKLSNRVDLEGIGDLDLKFIRPAVTGRKPTLVDISDVDYIASIGLRMLVITAKALNKFDARLVLFEGVSSPGERR